MSFSVLLSDVSRALPRYQYVSPTKSLFFSGLLLNARPLSTFYILRLQAASPPIFSSQRLSVPHWLVVRQDLKSTVYSISNLLRFSGNADTYTRTDSVIKVLMVYTINTSTVTSIFSSNLDCKVN